MQEHASYYREETCQVADLKKLTDQTTVSADMPHAEDIRSNIPIYDIAQLRPALGAPQTRQAVMAEWARVLMDGPGIVVLRQACPDHAALDAAAVVFNDIIAEEKEIIAGADHFAASGANDRIWNAAQKLCLRDPEIFLRCFASPAVHAVCEAWLGPGYQMTAQVNVVHPGGSAQQAHRDYHLGFQTAEMAARYPAHVHHLSPVLTLQGAIAHCDMPIESGPTKLLPYSQSYKPGYMAWRRDDFRAFFEDNCVQLPLRKGDALFFNPALFHAAGANTSKGIHRMANLLQVCSGLGRAMENLDRRSMCKALYPVALASELPADEVAAAVSSCAEGYSFPTSLDRDPPVGGLVPRTQQDLFFEALQQGQGPDEFAQTLDALAARQSA